MLENKRIKTKIFLFFILSLGLISRVNSVKGQNSSKLDIMLSFETISYSLGKPDTLMVGFRMQLTFIGEEPPESALLSLPLEQYDNPENLLKETIDLTATFGPWRLESDNVWTLQEIRSGGEGVMLLPFEFSIDRNNSWPNEIMEIKVFCGFSTHTISGEFIESMDFTLHINNPTRQIENRDYYFMKNNLLDSDVTIMNPDGPLVSGALYNLIISHEKTSIMAYSLIPWLIIFYNIWFFASILILLLWIYNKIFKIKYKIILNIIDDLNIFLKLDLFLIGFLITMIFQVKDYIPVWYSSLFINLNNLLLGYLVLNIIFSIMPTFQEGK